MKFRSLGHSGLKVSVIGLGTNSFGSRADRETSIEIIHQALENGINFIDTANVYTKTESESIIGLALEDKRHNAVLATKAGQVRGEGANDRGSSRYHLMRELEGSLKRLKTDYIDLYQIHKFDPDTPIEETLRALDDMVRSGKVRYIGSSNYAAWQLMKALSISERKGLHRYVSNQISYSLADRTPEIEQTSLCLDQGVGIIPYYPLAGGILTGKYSAADLAPAGSRASKDPNFGKFLNDERIALGKEVTKLASDLGCSSGALSLSWLIQRPAVSTVIVGATRVEQLRENLKSVSLILDEDTQKELERISHHFRNKGFYRIEK